MTDTQNRKCAQTQADPQTVGGPTTRREVDEGRAEVALIGVAQVQQHGSNARSLLVTTSVYTNSQGAGRTRPGHPKGAARAWSAKAACGRAVLKRLGQVWVLARRDHQDGGDRGHRAGRHRTAPRRCRPCRGTGTPARRKALADLGRHEARETSVGGLGATSRACIGRRHG